MLKKYKQHESLGHRKRLRERFMQSGLEGFLDYEIVELLLTLGTPRKDCKQTAKEAIKKFKGLAGVNEKKKDILFIEASKEYKPGKAKNILSEENIDKIYNTYAKRKTIEKFSRTVKPNEIKENDCNLNITRYVDTFEEEEEIDISANLKELKKLEPELAKLKKEMDAYLKKLNIK